MTTHWADIDLLSVSSLEAPVFKREQFTCGLAGLLAGLVITAILVVTLDFVGQEVILKMTDKMENLLIKINRAGINYVTMVSPNNKPDMVKILNKRTLVPIAEFNTATGELLMLEHHYGLADLVDLQKLIKIVAEELQL